MGESDYTLFALVEKLINASVTVKVFAGNAKVYSNSLKKLQLGLLKTPTEVYHS